MITDDTSAITHRFMEHNIRLNQVKIVDVAKASGFAPSTVSIVLNNAPVSRRVPERTKEHIKKIAKDLGYRPDVFARSLRSRRSSTIGVMIFDISDPFCVQALDGIEKTLDPMPYLPIMMDARGDRKRFESYLEMLIQRRVEGLIVVANWMLGESRLLLDIKNDLPIVVVGRDFSHADIPSVLVDNEAGGYMAIQHLYELGHREIAVIRGPKKMMDGTQRWRGIQRFARDRGFLLDRRRVRQIPLLWDARSVFACGESLTKDLLLSSPRFTALVAFDDLTALGAVHALSSAGFSVPRDCSVIGFDDVLPAAVSTPGLTTVRQPLAEIGAMTTECIFGSLHGSTAQVPLLRVLAPSLVFRESTTKLRR